MADKLAGIDVHKKVVMVVVIDPHNREEKPERRRFLTMPGDLRLLSNWLRDRGVKEAVMESTAQYWRSVWLELEPHMRLHLAQAYSNRAPRGRKHDFRDAERLVRRLPHRDAAFDLILGKWGEAAGPDDRRAISVGFRVLDTGPSFMVQDASARRIGSSSLVSTALDRKDIVGTPIAPAVFDICDLIYLADPRIAELRD